MNIKHIIKSFGLQFAIFITISCVFWVVYAAWNTPVNSWDTMTADWWNDLVAKVESIDNSWWSITQCTNENSDWDGTDDIAACLDATDPGNGTHRFHSCYNAGNISSWYIYSGAWSVWNGTGWLVRNDGGNFYCADGSVWVIKWV